MSFIAPTRSKKFKKLCLIAYSIINEWGFGYFWYIARKEWKEKGFSIFYPDEKPVPLFDRISFQKHYEQYLKLIEKKFHHEFSNSIFPQITFLVYYDSNQVENLRFILKYFLDQ